jgi:hypothetical protein
MKEGRKKQKSLLMIVMNECSIVFLADRPDKIKTGEGIFKLDKFEFEKLVARELELRDEVSTIAIHYLFTL